MLEIIKSDDSSLARFFAARLQRDENIDRKVAEIIADVQKFGDEALLRYTALFDGVKLCADELVVRKKEIDESYKAVDKNFVVALRQAIASIESFHRQQLEHSWFVSGPQGEMVGQLVHPMSRVGIYIPGGRAWYPSSVIMSAIPARIAGVREIVMVTPPGAGGKVSPHVLVAAREAGVSEIYRAGGAQAVASLAFGTDSIRPVDKIVGPGNIYVTYAKRQVYGQVGIDMLAGPSEVLIIGDGSVDPRFAAADLIAQAEHDENACACLFTPDEDWAAEVEKELEIQLDDIPRRETVMKALSRHGVMVITQDLFEAMELANKFSPEHLELLVEDPFTWLTRIENAGAVFLGAYAPVAVGDYLAGPNHVLPTAASSRFCSPLGVYDFIKRTGLVYYTSKTLLEKGGAVMRLAQTEGLEAHARAVGFRLLGKS